MAVLKRRGKELQVEETSLGPNTTELLPSSIRKNIGTMMIAKGVTDDGLLRLYQWDAIDRCTGEDCPSYSSCTAAKTGQCSVQLAYVQSILDMVYRNYEEYLSEPLLFRIGMHILPMYKMLCKLKIAEMGCRSACYYTPKGDIKIHPIFREIRNTISTISMLWKDFGLPLIAEEPEIPFTKHQEED